MPTGVQIFCWLATLWDGRPVFKTPLLFVVGFIVTFVIGGLTGVMVASVPLDTQVHDTYFVVAHFHYVLIGGAVFPLLGAIYYWFPKITGRMMSERLGRWVFWLVFVGFNLTFFPMHILGLHGHAAAGLHLPAGDAAGAASTCSSAVERRDPRRRLPAVLRRRGRAAARAARRPATTRGTRRRSNGRRPRRRRRYNFARIPVVDERRAALGTSRDDAAGRRRACASTAASCWSPRVAEARAAGARVLAAQLDLAVLDRARDDRHADRLDLHALGGGLGLDPGRRSR